MHAVRERHPTRGATRRTLAGADDKCCANTDPGKDGVTVPHSHHLQLYRQPARIAVVSGDIPEHWPGGVRMPGNGGGDGR
jgi:hypothetical protein